MHEPEVHVVCTGHAISADDASLMMKMVQKRSGYAAYVMIGSGNYGPNHSPTFDLDEDVLNPAADSLESAIRASLPGGSTEETRSM